MEDKLHLSIEGMHCGACIRRVTAALSGLEGVQVESVEIGSADVKFNPGHISPDRIAAAVERIGFSAKVRG